MMKKIPTLLAGALLACSTTTLDAQTSQDSAAIRTTALNYIEGWYDGDAERMERALHPDMVKRNVRSDARTNRSTLVHEGALRLVQRTRTGGGRRIPAEQRRTDVRILDITGNAASVRVDALLWIDYLHIARLDGEWKIVNVLFEDTPPPADPDGLLRP